MKCKGNLVLVALKNRKNYNVKQDFGLHLAEFFCVFAVRSRILRNSLKLFGVFLLRGIF